MAVESVLLERDGEGDALREVLADVAGDRSGRLVLIEGPAGIGKTRLLRHLRRLAVEHGFAVLSARASTLERSYAYGVVRQWLERPARSWQDADPAAVAAVEAVLGPVRALTVPGGELATLHGLRWLTADTCREPTALLLDDVQWSDAESLRYLEYLRLRLDDLPVLLALGARDEPALPDSLAGLGAEPGVVVLRPAPLTQHATAELLGASLGSIDPAFGAVTTKTVELHLTNAYRKLGVSRRQDLAAALSG